MNIQLSLQEVYFGWDFFPSSWGQVILTWWELLYVNCFMWLPQWNDSLCNQSHFLPPEFPMEPVRGMNEVRNINGVTGGEIWSSVRWRIDPWILGKKELGSWHPAVKTWGDQPQRKLIYCSAGHRIYKLSNCLLAYDKGIRTSSHKTRKGLM